MKGRGDYIWTILVFSILTLILPPAFAEAASRRQASEGEYIIEEISSMFG
jgi:hypothetical protein